LPLAQFGEKTDVPTTRASRATPLLRALGRYSIQLLPMRNFGRQPRPGKRAALNQGTLARIALIRHGAAAGGSYVLVTFPSGETRRMTPGPSTDITKAVIEVFAPRFLQSPAVLFVSESGNKVVARDDISRRPSD